MKQNFNQHLDLFNLMTNTKNNLDKNKNQNRGEEEEEEKPNSTN